MRDNDLDWHTTGVGFSFDYTGTIFNIGTNYGGWLSFLRVVLRRHTSQASSTRISVSYASSGSAGATAGYHWDKPDIAGNSFFNPDGVSFNDGWYWVHLYNIGLTGRQGHRVLQIGEENGTLTTYAQVGTTPNASLSLEDYAIRSSRIGFSGGTLAYPLTAATTDSINKAPVDITQFRWLWHNSGAFVAPFATAFYTEDRWRKPIDLTEEASELSAGWGYHTAWHLDGSGPGLVPLAHAGDAGKLTLIQGSGSLEALGGPALI